MKKDLGVLTAVYPMPVLMVATYDKDEQVDVMNAAWGQIVDYDKIMLVIGEGKKTWLNIKESKAFTVALADQEHMAMADYYGLVAGNQDPDKFNRSGYHAIKSTRVQAPIIEEFKVVMECELLQVYSEENLEAIVGKIVNVQAEESILNEEGKIDVTKLNALMFDPFGHGYYTTGEKVGQAFSEGKKYIPES